MTLRAAAPDGGGLPRRRPRRSGPRGRGGGGRARVPRRRCSRWGKDGVLAHLRAFGRLSYDAGAPAVRADTMYDLASLTKVIVTTTMAMILVDEGKLDLDKPVSAFLPEFRGGAKDKVTVWHLLTHSVGHRLVGAALQGAEGQGRLRQAHRRPWTSCTSRARSRSTATSASSCWARSSSGWPGRTSSRSRARGSSSPLGMKDTTYRPGPELLPRIAPTENDPWRGHVVHGEVHDENASAMGGVAAARRPLRHRAATSPASRRCC